MRNILIAILIVLGADAFAQRGSYMGIIPAPVSVKKSKGEFRLTSETIILTDSPNHKAVKFFAEYLRKSGLGNSITDMSYMDEKHRNIKNAITLSVSFKDELPTDGYQLYVDDNRITINGRNAGLFYGVQTLIQLIEHKGAGSAIVPCVTVKDHPRFHYRGMHLDVSRHFFDVDFVKRYIDLMAAYKLNTFHWHLTDDQGWRIEIKKYPKLTEVGSKRAQTKVGRAAGGETDSLYDNMPYEGFYTQDQIKEVVEYAAARFINIVPEIEMPGHSNAILAAYPEVSCDPDKKYTVWGQWGANVDVLCPTEETFTMLNNILLEVMDLFPGKYIHIGGDECMKDAWKKSVACQQIIADKGLKDEDGLQSYFIGRIEKFVNSQGRQIIGWDEILEGGLAPNATVMSWRGEKGGIAAAQQNHDVIMTPGSGGMYFDHTQFKSPQEPLSIGGNAPISKTYAYDPIPSVLTNDQQKHIIGVQANLWTEYITTATKAEYMLLPRLLALAEVAWSPAANKDYRDFSEQRMPYQLARLETAGYNFRVPPAIGAMDTVIKGDKFKIELKPSVEGAKVYYTIDGYTPRETDQVYTNPLQIVVPPKKHVTLKTIVITPGGKRSVYTEMKMENK